MAETLFVLTNDDPGMQAPELFAELLDFLKAQAVPATFFVVPFADQKPLDQKPEWVELLQRAREEGHELQHHGYTHKGTFEFGVPPGFMLDIIPEAKAQWEQDPLAIQVNHTYSLLYTHLAHGQEIFQQTFGFTPKGFRAPCLATCDHMYRALHDLGFAWSSNEVINPMGWRYINRDYKAGEPWQPEVPTHPYQHASGLIEAPMHSEYTWYLTEDDIDRHVALAKSDLDRAHAAGEAFVALSHYFAMTGQWSAGLRVYEKLFDHARRLGNVRFATVSELVATAV